jgi:hypothetical protein
VATSTRTYERDTPLKPQTWTQSPPSASEYNVYIEQDLNGKILQTLGFPVECNFDLDPHGLGDVDTMTALNFNLSFLGLLLTAGWVSLEIELRRRSDDGLIATTSPQILAADGTWHRSEAFNWLSGLSLSSAEADDLRIRCIGDSDGGFGSALLQFDSIGHATNLGPTMVYDVVVPAPTVSSIVPDEGPSTGETAFTITGTNFQAAGAGANVVTFNGTPATGIVTVNDTTITGVSPAGYGTVDVTVTNNNGTDTLVDGWDYLTVAQGQVILERDRDLTAAVQLKERTITLVQDRDLAGAVQLKERLVTLVDDRQLTEPVRVKTRRPE